MKNGLWKALAAVAAAACMLTATAAADVTVPPPAVNVTVSVPTATVPVQVTTPAPATATVKAATGTVKATAKATVKAAVGSTTKAAHGTQASTANGVHARTHTALSNATHAAANAPASGTVASTRLLGNTTAGRAANDAAATVRSHATANANGAADVTRSSAQVAADALVRVCLATNVVDHPAAFFNVDRSVLAASNGTLKAVVGNVCPFAKTTGQQTVSGVNDPSTLSSNGTTVICYHTGLINDPYARVVVSQATLKQDVQAVPAHNGECPRAAAGLPGVPATTGSSASYGAGNNGVPNGGSGASANGSGAGSPGAGAGGSTVPGAAGGGKSGVAGAKSSPSQAAATSGAASRNGVLGAVAHGTLPYTGFPLWIAVMIAVAVIGVGLLMARTRKNPTRDRV